MKKEEAIMDDTVEIGFDVWEDVRLSWEGNEVIMHFPVINDKNYSQVILRLNFIDACKKEEFIRILKERIE